MPGEHPGVGTPSGNGLRSKPAVKATARSPGSGHEASILHASSPEWRDCEESLARNGTAVPLDHRRAWLELLPDASPFYVAVRDTARDRWCCGFPVQVARTRTLPGHRILRVTRFGAGDCDAGLEAAVRALRELARDNPRFVRLNVEVFCRSSERRAALWETFSALGFYEVERPRWYERTVVIDLAPKEDEILASFHKTGRQNVRAPAKKGLTVAAITDPAYAPRMQALSNESFARTGREAPRRDWAARLRFSASHPELYRIVGTLDPTLEGPDDLLAFTCGSCHGNYASYEDGASTRDVEGNVPLSYAPLWELVRWAKDVGCEWFDMGGIPRAKPEPESDPREGISRFKRYFTEEIAVVGGEWEFVPDRIRSRVSHLVSQALERLRG